MAAFVETKIWMALKNRLLQITPLPAFAFPGEIFTPNGPYVRADFIINAPERVTVNERPHNRLGILALTTVHPLSASGEVMLNLAGSLAHHFPVDSVHTFQDVCVRIRAEPHVLGGFEDNGNWQIPVNITWQCFA